MTWPSGLRPMTAEPPASKGENRRGVIADVVDHGRERGVADVRFVIEAAGLGQHMAVGGHVAVGVRIMTALGRAVVPEVNRTSTRRRRGW